MAIVPQRKPMPEKADVSRESLATESNSASLPAEEIYRMIRETAYFKAEARGFAPGVELQDWLDAEKEVWDTLEGARARKSEARAP